MKGISRVNPRQVITIARLELIGAVTAVEMAHEIQKELDIPLNGVFYHTDSTTVLQMIRSTSQRFKIFVANRLSIIHMLSKPEQWFHVAGQNNPSDLASRGISPDKLHKMDSWFTGPPMLYDMNYNWQNQPSPEELTPDVIQEIKINFSDVESTNQNSKLPQSIRELLIRHSKFETLQKSIAWLRRFISFITSKHIGSDQQTQARTGPLQVSELDAASDIICKLIQLDSLDVERSYFASQTKPGPPIGIKGKLSSPYAKAILKCNPFLSDNDGILRVGGRLSHADVPYSQKYPIILPPYHHSTKLIIDYHHRRLGHSGTLHVLASIRSQYWILHGQSAVAKALRECIQCRIRDAKPGEQWMSDLPSARVSIGQPVFSNTYCDYFGPIMVKVGRSSYKRYGVVFTCLSTRAVHLEVAESLDTSAFLQAFTRFTSRRLPPKVMRSDNGTNLVSGSKELQEGIERWNKKYFESYLAQSGCKWIFSPPLAPHQGGCVERIVKESKKILKNLIGDKGLTDYSLWTFMCGVESILNDRPLTKMSDDPRDSVTLSPNAILIGRLDPSLPPDIFMRTDEYRTGYRHVQRLLDLFWQRFVSEYLPILQERSKWHNLKTNFQPGQLVLMKDEATPRGVWPKALIVETYPDREGVVRRVKVRTAKNEYIRDIRKLCPLEIVE